MTHSTQRLVVGISGASGARLGIRLLEALRETQIESHLVITPSARRTIAQETNWKIEDVFALATANYSPDDLGAAISSGSFLTRGMVVIPCSIKSLSAVANSYTADLLSRAADVTLKEGRPLILAVRETPLHAGHLRLMRLAAEAGAVIFPPMPAFYAHIQTMDDMVDGFVGRVLDRLGIENRLAYRWSGVHGAQAEKAGEDAVQRELLSMPLMTLATRGADGQPHAAPVFFAADGVRALYFFSSGGSQHAHDLVGSPQAAVAIHAPAGGWREVQGLQLRGVVRAVNPGPEWDRAWELYREKFPFAAEEQIQAMRDTLFVFEPAWVRAIDHARGFGYSDEWDVS